jgi:threonine dehydratase
MLTPDQIETAANRLAPYLQPTPVLQNARLDEIAGRVVLLKAECLNVTGSFKIRGALNRMLCIPHAQRGAGVVAMSSGNHAQAVAQAARWLDLQATIVMPRDAPQIKLRNTQALGAAVVLYDRANEDRDVIAGKIANQTGATIVHPYDDLLTMAGQGTCGMELAHYAKAQKIELTCVAAPCSGGGLIAGVGTAIHQEFAQAQIFAVEPDGYDDHQQSLRQQQRVCLTKQPTTLCDALQAPTPGEKTFATNQQQLAGAVSVSDAQVLQAMQFAAQQLKLVLEPGGAAALAALLAKQLPSGSGALGLVLSGGNVDPELFARAITSTPAWAER